MKRKVKNYPAGNLLEVGPFNDAIAVIQRRLGDENKAAAEGKSSGPKVRFWADLSGTFEIEATLIDVKEHKAILKKKDGRQVAVPLEKLSDEDQEFVKGYLKTQAEKKPENPFE